MASSVHSTHASLRERIVEHAFVGDALRELWRKRVIDVEVLRSEFDAFGYDLVMSRGEVVRHIQLKASTRDKPRRVSIGRRLFQKPAGCVLWIKVTDELEMGPFYWLGGSPNEPLPEIAGLRAAKGKRNREGKRQDRHNHVYVPGSKFEPLKTLPDVLEKLFGKLT